MTLLLKDPASSLDYEIDWGAAYLGTDQIIESQWTVAPIELGGIVVVESTFTPTVSTVMASGGTSGRIYRLVNEVVLASGRRDRRSVTLRVETR